MQLAQEPEASRRTSGRSRTRTCPTRRRTAASSATCATPHGSRPGSTPTVPGCGRPAWPTTPPPAASGPPAQLLDHHDRPRIPAARRHLRHRAWTTAADRVLGRPTPQPPVARELPGRPVREPTPVIRVRPGAVGGAAVEAFTPAGWRRTAEVPATFRPASAATVLSYLDSLSQPLAQRPARPRSGVGAAADRPAAGPPVRRRRRRPTGPGSRPPAGASSSGSDGSVSRSTSAPGVWSSGRRAGWPTRWASPRPRWCRSASAPTGTGCGRRGWPTTCAPAGVAPELGVAQPHRGARVPAGRGRGCPRSRRRGRGRAPWGPARAGTAELRLLPRPGRRAAHARSRGSRPGPRSTSRSSSPTCAGPAGRPGPRLGPVG